MVLMVMARIRDQLVDIVRAPAGASEWLGTVMGLLEPGVDLGAVIRGLVPHVDVRKVMRTMGQELLRSLFMPLQNMVAVMVRPLIEEVSAHTEMVVASNLRVLRSGLASVWAQLSDAFSHVVGKEKWLRDFVKVYLPFVEESISLETSTWPEKDGRMAYILDFLYSVKGEIDDEFYVSTGRMLVSKVGAILSDLVAAGREEAFALMRLVFAGLADFRRTGDLRGALSRAADRALALMEDLNVVRGGELLPLKDLFFETFMQTLAESIFAYFTVEWPSKIVAAFPGEAAPELEDSIQYGNFSSLAQFLFTVVREIASEIVHEAADLSQLGLAAGDMLEPMLDFLDGDAFRALTRLPEWATFDLPSAGGSASGGDDSDGDGSDEYDDDEDGDSGAFRMPDVDLAALDPGVARLVSAALDVVRKLQFTNFLLASEEFDDVVEGLMGASGDTFGAIVAGLVGGLRGKSREGKSNEVFQVRQGACLSVMSVCL